MITVCRNSRTTIADTFDSLQSQTYSNIEHIVIDGASTDGTLELLQRHRAAITHLISEPDKGIYDAMNKGLRLATGEYVAYLNADDVYAHADVISRVVSVATEGDYDAVYGDLVYVSQSDPQKIIRYWRSCKYKPGMVEWGWMPAHPTFFIKTAILREIGGFDIRFRYQADFELMLRLFSRRRISSAHIPEILVRMRTGGQSNRSVSNIIKGNLDSYTAAREHGVAKTPLWIVRKLWYRVPQLFSRP